MRCENKLHASQALSLGKKKIKNNIKRTTKSRGFDRAPTRSTRTEFNRVRVPTVDVASEFVDRTCFEAGRYSLKTINPMSL